ncbi:MAG TPA: hypothetical protein PKO15_04190 [Fibrobacteria bacterium]|nr:hypothetical protein [Fibrobacteria bacterium]
MNPRISVALLSASMLAGCGFSDSSNYAGGAFLDAQGETVSARSNATLAASTRSVEALSPEGYPSLPGMGILVAGTVGSDSIRTVLGFDLRTPSAWGGPDGLRTNPLKSLDFTVSDATWAPRLRLRMVLAKGAGASLPAVFMGVEPSGLPGLRVVLDTVVNPTSDADGMHSIPLPASVSDSILATSASDRGWLAVILDPQVVSAAQPSLVRFLQQPSIRIDSLPSLTVGTWLNQTATRSVQMRASGASSDVIGWWAGSGRRVRLELDGDAIRSSLHRQVPSDVSTPELDHSYHVLQARASLGFDKLVSNPTSARMQVVARVVEREDSSSLTLEHTLGMPSSVLTESEAGSSVGVRCTTLVADILADCSVLTGSEPQKNGVHLAYVNNKFGDYLQTHFWLRLDQPDHAEFPVLNNLRVAIRSEGSGHGGAKLRVKWTRLYATYNPDSQSDSLGWRSGATLGAGSNRVELEIRSALSQVIQQKARKVVLDIVPVGGNVYGLDLWTAHSSSPSQWIDSIRVLVRPRDGGNI